MIVGCVKTAALPYVYENSFFDDRHLEEDGGGRERLGSVRPGAAEDGYRGFSPTQLKLRCRAYQHQPLSL